MVDRADKSIDPSSFIKVVMLGNERVGKTSIVHRFINNKFVHDIGKTVGGSFSSKKITVGKETK